MPIDLYAMHADMIATSGHKGCSGRWERESPHSAMNSSTTCLPSARAERGRKAKTTATDPRVKKYESGSLNLPGIAGLEAGLDYLQDNARSAGQNKQRLTKMLLEGCCRSRRHGLRRLDRPTTASPSSASTSAIWIATNWHAAREPSAHSSASRPALRSADARKRSERPPAAARSVLAWDAFNTEERAVLDLTAGPTLEDADASGGARQAVPSHDRRHAKAR